MARSLGLQFDANAPDLQSIAEQLERNELLRDLVAQFASMRGQAATYRDQAADAFTNSSSPLSQMFGNNGDQPHPLAAMFSGAANPIAEMFGNNGDQPHPLASMFARGGASAPSSDTDEDLYGGANAASFGGCADAWMARMRQMREAHDRQNRAASRSASTNAAAPGKLVETLAHETVPVGSVMLPEQAFVKIWKCKALGDWPAGARCQYASGERMGDHRAAIVAPDGGSTVRAGTEVRIVLDGQTTQRIGRQRSVYRVVSADGRDLGGDDLVVDVEVAKPL